MKDCCGREIDYIRISVTDRCNLRCAYCMPVDGVKMTSHEELLSHDEILRVCRIMAGMGISKVKLTGGEPLIRRGLDYLVKEIKMIDGIRNVTLTTNGMILDEKIDALAAAGIDSINISLDTLNPEVFRKITRIGDVERVKAGIMAALDHPEIATKINCVPFGLPDQNIWEVASFARDHHIHVRYIEMMPIGLGKEYDCLNEQEIRKMLEEHYGPLTLYNKRLGNGPCVYYDISGFRGKVGFISAVSHKFCSQCNRVRLTSQGFLKTCLQYDVGGDLKELLRGNVSDNVIEERIRDIILHKPTEHHFESAKTGALESNEQRIMSQIGG